jgi:adenylate kinase family enzyme
MKILILGNVGAGKTTFSNKLSKILKIKNYSLDDIVYDKDLKRNKIEVEKIINNISKEDNWLMEGTLRHDMHYLLKLPDLIILLDPPYYLIKYRIITRFIKQKLRITKANYKVDLKLLKQMFKWAKAYNINKPMLIKEIAKYHQKLIITKSFDIK